MLKSRSTKVSPFADRCALRPPGANGGAMQSFGQFGTVQAAQGWRGNRWFVYPVELAPIGVLPQPTLLMPVRPLPGRPAASPVPPDPLASAPAPPVPAAPPLPVTTPGVSVPGASIVAPPLPDEPPLPPPTAPPLPPDDPAFSLPLQESAARHATTPNLRVKVATNEPDAGRLPGRQRKSRDLPGRPYGTKLPGFWRFQDDDAEHGCAGFGPANGHAGGVRGRKRRHRALGWHRRSEGRDRQRRSRDGRPWQRRRHRKRR